MAAESIALAKPQEDAQRAELLSSELVVLGEVEAEYSAAASAGPVPEVCSGFLFLQTCYFRSALFWFDIFLICLLFSPGGRGPDCWCHGCSDQFSKTPYCGCKSFSKNCVSS